MWDVNLYKFSSSGVCMFFAAVLLEGERILFMGFYYLFPTLIINGPASEGKETEFLQSITFHVWLFFFSMAS